MSDEFCKDGEKLFDSFQNMSTNDKIKQDIMYAKTLYENAKFYYGTNELSGALVSFSCCAVLLNSIMGHLGLNDTIVPPSSPPSASPSTPSTPSSAVAVQDTTSIKEGANRLLNCCLNAVQELQGRVKKNSGSNSKDEEKKDWEKICTNLNPLVFKEGGGDCLFFSDVAGMIKEKDILKSSLIYPLTYPNLYPKTAKGILLYGPPGTGKTFIVKAAVNELQKTDPNIAVLFFAPSPGDLKGKYVGETEKKIEEWFTCASKAACDAQLTCPKKKQYISILFMDEFDAIGPDRSQDNTGFASNSVNTILQMMDGVSSKKNVTVIAATNFPWSLDSAILRRFDTQILVNLPTEQDIEEVINIELKKVIQLRNVENVDTYCNNEIQVYQKGKEKKSADNCNNNTCVENIKEDLTTKAPYNAMTYDYYDNKNRSFFTGLRAELKSKNFSNSDISRLMKYASTYTGKMAISNNLFYSTDLIRDLQREYSLYVSSLTRMRDSDEGIKVAVDTLNFYLQGGRDGSLPNGIIEINRPDIVKVNHDGKVFINSKCLFYKNNDLIINDSKIKDVYFHIDIKGEKIEIEEYKTFLNKIESDIDTTTVDTIITFNINIKEKVGKNKNEQVFLFPISTKILNIVFKPLYEIYAEVLQNILKLEMLDASDKEIEDKLKELEIKKKECDNIKKGLYSSAKNSIMDYLKSIAVDNIYNLLKDKLENIKNTGSSSNKKPNSSLSKNNDVAKQYAENVFSVGDKNYDEFLKDIKTSTLFRIKYEDNNFFSYGLEAILNNYGSFNTLTNKINILAKKDGENALINNFYDFYTYLLLYKCAEDYKDDSNSNFKETYLDTEFLDKPKFENLKLNYLMNSYLSSLNEYDKKVSLFKTDINMPELVLRTTLINENILQISNLVKLISKSTDLNTEGNITLIKTIIGNYKEISQYIYTNFYKKELLDNESNDPSDAEIISPDYLKKLQGKFNSLPKFYTIDTKFYKQSSSKIPLYLIQYPDKGKNEEILININQYIDYTSNFKKINNIFKLFKIENLQNFYIKIDFDFFTEIFKKNIDVRGLKTTYNEQIGRNKKNLSSVFDLIDNFNTVEQQLIQLYINDVFQFCKTIDRIDLTQLDDTVEEDKSNDGTSGTGLSSSVGGGPKEDLEAEIARLESEITQLNTEYEAKDAVKDAAKAKMIEELDKFIRPLNSMTANEQITKDDLESLQKSFSLLAENYKNDPNSNTLDLLKAEIEKIKPHLNTNLVDKTENDNLYTAVDEAQKEYLKEYNKFKVIESGFESKKQEKATKEKELQNLSDPNTPKSELNNRITEYNRGDYDDFVNDPGSQPSTPKPPSFEESDNESSDNESSNDVKNENSLSQVTSPVVKSITTPPESKEEKAKKSKLDTLKETIIGLYLKKLSEICTPDESTPRNSLSSGVTQNILGLVCKRLNDNYDFVRYKKICILGQYLNTSNNKLIPINYKDFIDTQIQDSGAVINVVKRVNGNPVYWREKPELSKTATVASNTTNQVIEPSQTPKAMVDSVLAEFNKLLSPPMNKSDKKMLGDQSVLLGDQTVLGIGQDQSQLIVGGKKSLISKQTPNAKNSTLKRAKKHKTNYKFSKNKSLRKTRLQKGGQENEEEKALRQAQENLDANKKVLEENSAADLEKEKAVQNISLGSSPATNNVVADNTIVKPTANIAPTAPPAQEAKITYIDGYDNDFIDLFIKNGDEICKMSEDYTKNKAILLPIYDYMTKNNIGFYVFDIAIMTAYDNSNAEFDKTIEEQAKTILNPDDNTIKTKEEYNIKKNLLEKYRVSHKLFDIYDCFLKIKDNTLIKVNNMIESIKSDIESLNLPNAKNTYDSLSKIMMTQIYKDGGNTNKTVLPDYITLSNKFEELNKKVINDLKTLYSNQTMLTENIAKIKDLDEQNFFKQWWTIAGNKINGSKDKWYNDMIEEYTKLQKYPQIPTKATNIQKLNFIKQEVDLRIKLADLVYSYGKNFVLVQPLYEDAYNIAIKEITNFPGFNKKDSAGNINITDIQFFYNAILEIGGFYKNWSESKLKEGENYEARKLAKKSYLYMEQQFMFLFNYYTDLGVFFSMPDYKKELKGFVASIKNDNMFEIIIKSIYYLADSYFFFGSNKSIFKMNDSEDYDIFIIKANILMKLCEEMLNTSKLEAQKEDEEEKQRLEQHSGLASPIKKGLSEGIEMNLKGTVYEGEEYFVGGGGTTFANTDQELKGGALNDVTEQILNVFKPKIQPLITTISPEKYPNINLTSIKTHIINTTAVDLEKIKKNEYDNKIATEYRDIILKQTTEDTTILNMEQYGFLEFCTSKDGNLMTGTKKVVSKTVFIRTVFSLSQFKQMAQYGTIWKSAKNQIKIVGDTIKKHIFNANNTLTTDQKYMARAFLDQLENKNLLTSLFINNVVAVGFLIDPVNKSIIDDKFIFDTGNKMAIIRWIDINTSGQNAYTALSASLFWLQHGIAFIGMGYGSIKLFQGAIWSLQNMPGYSSISQFISGYFGSGAVTGENVASAAAGNVGPAIADAGAAAGNVGPAIADAGAAIVDNPTPTPQPTEAPEWAKNIGDAGAGVTDGGFADGGLGDYAYWIILALGLILSIMLIWKEIQGWNKDLKSSQEIITNIISKQIFHIIIVKGFLEVDSFDIDPAEAFISELNNLINTVITIIDGIEKQDPKSKGRVFTERTGNYFTYNPSEATLKDINTDFFATLLQKSTDSEIDKKLLTNLNIPVKAFANALLNVKSTDVAETRKKLQDYYDDKDKMLADLKKEKSKA